MGLPRAYKRTSPPRLDGRNFDDILTEACNRIPGYTPEWTDMNPSDPGFTMLEIFSWLSETVLWELNQIPERSFEAFLDLVHLPAPPSMPAKTTLCFEAREINKV